MVSFKWLKQPADSGQTASVCHSKGYKNMNKYNAKGVKTAVFVLCEIWG
jgi:hypothetical protein